MTHDELRELCNRLLKRPMSWSDDYAIARATLALLNEVAPLPAERDKLKEELGLLHGAHEESVRVTRKNVELYHQITELEAQLKTMRKSLSSIRWTAETHTKGILGTQNFKNVPMQQIIDQVDKALGVYEDKD